MHWQPMKLNWWCTFYQWNQRITARLLIQHSNVKQRGRPGRLHSRQTAQWSMHHRYLCHEYRPHEDDVRPPHSPTDTHRQTDIDTDRQTHRQTDRQTWGRCTPASLTYRHRQTQTDRHTQTDIDTHRHTQTDRHTHTDRQTDRHEDDVHPPHLPTHTDRHRHTQT